MTTRINNSSPIPENYTNFINKNRSLSSPQLFVPAASINNIANNIIANSPSSRINEKEFIATCQEILSKKPESATEHIETILNNSDRYEGNIPSFINKFLLTEDNFDFLENLRQRQIEDFDTDYIEIESLTDSNSDNMQKIVTGFNSRFTPALTKFLKSLKNKPAEVTHFCQELYNFIIIDLPTKPDLCFYDKIPLLVAIQTALQSLETNPTTIKQLETFSNIYVVNDPHIFQMEISKKNLKGGHFLNEKTSIKGFELKHHCSTTHIPCKSPLISCNRHLYFGYISGSLLSKNNILQKGNPNNLSKFSSLFWHTIDQATVLQAISKTIAEPLNEPRMTDDSIEHIGSHNFFDNQNQPIRIDMMLWLKKIQKGSVTISLINSAYPIPLLDKKEANGDFLNNFSLADSNNLIATTPFSFDIKKPTTFEDGCKKPEKNQPFLDTLDEIEQINTPNGANHQLFRCPIQAITGCTLEGMFAKASKEMPCEDNQNHFTDKDLKNLITKNEAQLNPEIAKIKKSEDPASKAAETTYIYIIIY